MKILVTKILSPILAIVVLFSTMSFTVDKHYCGKMLVDIAINKKAKTCGMEMVSSSNDSLVGKKSCCQNEHIVILGQDELKKNFDNSIEFPITTLPVTHSYFQLESIQELPFFVNVGNHDPPERDLDFQSLYDTYLI